MESSKRFVLGTFRGLVIMNFAATFAGLLYCMMELMFEFPFGLRTRDPGRYAWIPLAWRAEGCHGYVYKRNTFEPARPSR